MWVRYPCDWQLYNKKMIYINKLRKNILSDDATIIHAIKCLNNSEHKICLILNKSKKLLGVMTDGDLRRAILKSSDFLKPINQFYNKNFTYCFEDTLKHVVKKKYMKDDSLLYIPVVDRKNLFIGLHLKKDFLEEILLKNEVVIMAGGMGKRLLPLTNNYPKPMLQVGGRPLLETIIYSLKSSNFVNINISVNYLKNKIINFFDDGKRLQLKIKYLIEKKPLGTIGSLSLLKNKIKEPILLINGDIYTSLKFENLISYHNSQKNEMTICVNNYSVQIPYGVINYKKIKKKIITEKPIFNFDVNSGIYVINPSLLKYIPKNKYCDMDTFINKIQKRKIGFFKIHETLIDIGDHKKFNKVQKMINND